MVYWLLPRYLVSVDLGQQSDYTAVCVLERNPERLTAEGTYNVVHLERWRNQPYTILPDRLRGILEQTRIRWSSLGAARGRVMPMENCPVDVLIDRTGVGAAPFDYLVAAGLNPVSIVIHGGSQVIRASARDYHVPKRDLVGAVQLLLQTKRLKWDPALPGTEVLTAELENFRARISASGHDTYAAGTAGGADDWRENAHDDTVLALSMACWFGEFQVAGRRRSTTYSTSYLEGEADDWDGPSRVARA